MRMLRRLPQVVRSRTVGQPSTGILSRQKFSTTVETDLSEPATTSRTAASTSRSCWQSNSAALSSAGSTPSLGIPWTAGANIHVSIRSILASTEPLPVCNASTTSSSATTKPSVSTTCQESKPALTRSSDG
eukprot:CAMPEP_0181514114 /NCGR_PEP_ID=MMETSP1110-20121109/62859_1 /TAXON_ID=174948 /ORGANISM="Symbiodinium sp., Strain CCMP421" /LENGTH=130 /DNA_ID=CAMNT_0023644025 /DNA_START=130 /DNA_END=522 /DNA_ORIENTATION=+